MAPRSTRVVATLNEGGFFGEIGILVENGRRTNTVVARTKCEYYTLQKSDLDWVLDRFPEYRQLLREAALKRLQEMAKVLDASLAGEEVSGAGIFMRFHCCFLFSFPVTLSALTLYPESFCFLSNLVGPRLDRGARACGNPRDARLTSHAPGF